MKIHSKYPGIRKIFIDAEELKGYGEKPNRLKNRLEYLR